MFSSQTTEVRTPKNIIELSNENSRSKLEKFGFDMNQSVDTNQNIQFALGIGLSAAIDIWSGTPLCCAAEQGDIELIKDLHAAGANINLCDETGNSPLLIAIREGHAEAVKTLLSMGADKNYCNTKYNQQATAQSALEEGKMQYQGLKGFFGTQYEKHVKHHDVDFDKTEKYLKSYIPGK